MWSESEVKVPQSCPTLWSHGLYSPWNSPGQKIEVGSLSLLQRIFPTQGSNPGLSHCRQIIYQLSQKGSSKLSPRGCGGGGLVVKSCPTDCDPMDYNLPGSSVHGILQERILEWIAISFSRGFSQPRNQTWVSWIAGRFFTNWAMRETQTKKKKKKKWKTLSPVPLFLSPRTIQVHGVFHARILEWVAFSLLQRIFPTQESNRGLLYCMWILYQMSYGFLQGSILEWVAFPFSRGFSQPRDWT